MISVSDNTHDKKSDRKSDKKSAQSRRFSIYSVDRKKHVPYGPVDSRLYWAVRAQRTTVVRPSTLGPLGSWCIFY